MGQIVVVAGNDVARAVLGSCIGLVIYDQDRKSGALAHVVLPRSDGQAAAPGKFVDTAVAEIIDLLRAEGSRLGSLSAKVVGGSNMFASKGPIQIGQQNIAAVRQALHDRGIRRAAEHVGGNTGRRIAFRPSDGSVQIELAGQPTVTI
jgi:chemotaxis protein CheD